VRNAWDAVNHPMLESAFDTSAGQKPWKPDGMLLCYPVLTMGEFVHAGSRGNLLGDRPADVMLRLLSLETQVNGHTVPAFLWHTEDDGVVPVENSLQYAAALRKAGVPFGLHIYQTGPHGISLCDETTSYTENLMVPDAAGWINLAIAWVKRQRP
jgi:acetyl esterase/lipase